MSSGERESPGHHLQSVRVQPASEEGGPRPRVEDWNVRTSHPLRRGLDHQDGGRLEESQHDQPLPSSRRSPPHSRSEAVEHVQHLHHVRQVRPPPVPQVRDAQPVEDGRRKSQSAAQPCHIPSESRLRQRPEDLALGPARVGQRQGRRATQQDGLGDLPDQIVGDEGHPSEVRGRPLRDDLQHSPQRLSFAACHQVLVRLLG